MQEYTLTNKGTYMHCIVCYWHKNIHILITFVYFSLGNYGEIIIKTPDEYWITGKTSNEREFYVIIQEKNANLKDISGIFHKIIGI